MSRALEVVVATLLVSVASYAAAQDASTATRVEALLGRMTLEEKLGLVSTSMPAFSSATRAMGAPISAAFNPGVPRLGVPQLRESDASLGVANGREMRKGDTATALPSGLATAASFDPAVAEAGGAMIGREARAKTFNVLLAGGVNLTRDPLGRPRLRVLRRGPPAGGRAGRRRNPRGAKQSHRLDGQTLRPEPSGDRAHGGGLADRRGRLARKRPTGFRAGHRARKAGLLDVRLQQGHADVGVLSGGGSSQVRSVGGAPIERPVTSGDASSFASETWHASSPLAAIRAAAPKARVSYVDGSDQAVTVWEVGYVRLSAA